MAKINIKPDFEQKLRKLRVLTKFKKEVTRLKTHNKFHHDVSYSFAWNDTLDGPDFWNDIYKKIVNLDKEETEQ